MLDSYEENELIWDESDTRLSNLTDKQLPRVSQKNPPTTASNSSLEKSLSICFSDISSISGPQENSDYSDESHNTSSTSIVKPVIHSSLNGRDHVDDEDLGPALNFDLDFDSDGDRNINGVSRLTHLTCDSISSSSIYSYSGDDRRSKSYSNLKDLDREARVVTSTNLQLAKWRDDTINCATPKKTGYRITFEIISARSVTTGSPSGVKNRHVSYTIIIKRCPGLESQPGVIERRYTEFSSLYMGLMKRFPIFLKDFIFPKKTLVGNFSSQIIRERSFAFQSLLTYCLSVDELRTSRPFIDFLHAKEMMEVRRALKSRNFEEAGNILENCYFIQEKITLQGVNDQTSAQIYQILVLLVASMDIASSPHEALNYAEKAIPMILESDFYDHHELTVPFLLLVERLFACSGKPIDAFARKIAQLKEKGIKTDKSPNLIELIVKKDFTNLTCLRFF